MILRCILWLYTSTRIKLFVKNRLAIPEKGGALLVQAEVELKPDGAYRFDADIQQKGDLPPAVEKFLSAFAEYKDGSYRLEWADKL